MDTITFVYRLAFFGVLICSSAFAQDKGLQSAERSLQAFKEASFIQNEIMVPSNRTLLRSSLEQLDVDNMNSFFTALKGYFVNTRGEEDANLITNPRGLIQGYIDDYTRASLLVQSARMDRVGPQTQKRVYQAWMKVAARFHLSQKQIQDAEIFVAMGPVNAYTNSGNLNKISMVFYEGLVDKMNDRELESVVGHELTHILSGHMYHSAENFAMIMQLIRALVYGVRIGAVDEGLQVRAQRGGQARNDSPAAIIEKIESTEAGRKMIAKVFEGYSDSPYGRLTPAAQSWGDSRQAPRDKFLEAMIALNSQLMAIPEKEAVGLIRKYLYGVRRVLVRSEVEADTIRAIDVMINHLTRYKVVQLDPYSVIVPMLKYLDVIGREHEVTADRGGLSVVDVGWQAVSTDLKFKGINFGARFESASPQDKKSVRKRVRLKTESLLHGTRVYEPQIIEKVTAEIIEENKRELEFRYKNSVEDRARSLANSAGNHPFPDQRVDYMMRFDQTYQLLSMRNPFFKLLAMYEQASQSVNELRAKAQESAQRAASVQAKLDDVDESKREGLMKVIESDIANAKAVAKAAEHFNVESVKIANALADAIEAEGHWDNRNIVLNDLIYYMMKRREQAILYLQDFGKRVMELEHGATFRPADADQIRTLRIALLMNEMTRMTPWLTSNDRLKGILKERIETRAARTRGKSEWKTNLPAMKELLFEAIAPKESVTLNEKGELPDITRTHLERISATLSLFTPPQDQDIVKRYEDAALAAPGGAAFRCSLVGYFSSFSADPVTHNISPYYVTESPFGNPKYWEGEADLSIVCNDVFLSGHTPAPILQKEAKP